MRNRFAGNCSLCNKHVGVKEGRHRTIEKQAQNFLGLRCLQCSTTTKKGTKMLRLSEKIRLSKLKNKSMSKELTEDIKHRIEFLETEKEFFGLLEDEQKELDSLYSELIRSKE